MKTLSQATAFLFAVVSSISVTSAIASIGSTASAADADSVACQQMFRPATTGGAVREQLTAKCNSEGQRSTYTGTSVEQPKSTSPDATTNVTRVSPDLNKPDLRSCPSVFKTGTTGGSVRESFEAMQKCKYGS